MNQFDQPDPVPNDYQPASWAMVISDMAYGSWPEHNMVPTITSLVIRDAAERDRMGAEKYGVRLQAFNGRDSLRDAYEEQLDATVYLFNAYRESGVPRKLYIDSLVLAFRIRKEIFDRDGM